VITQITLIEANKEVGLEVNAENTKYMLLAKSSQEDSKQIL
jgi:hypothetical protein